MNAFGMFAKERSGPAIAAAVAAHLLAFMALDVAIGDSAMAATRPTSMKVRVSDLDLARPADMDRLQLRIARAAREVCRDSSASLAAAVGIRKRCTEKAISNVQPQVARLAATHRARREAMALLGAGVGR